MLVLSFNVTHYFQVKFLFYLFSRYFFFDNARKSCAPFMEIHFPHDECLHGKIFLRNPLPPTHSHPNMKESPWKRLYTS